MNGICPQCKNKKESAAKDVYNIENHMADDKDIFLQAAKEKILDGEKLYRELYLSDTYAFLAPDNYNADSVEDIDVSVNEQLERASKEFDKVCRDIVKHFIWACEETDNTNILNHIKPWRIRDFVSEAEYQANKYKDNKRAYSMWKRVVNIGMQILKDDMTCVSEHLSKYDKL